MLRSKVNNTAIVQMPEMILNSVEGVFPKPV